MLNFVKKLGALFEFSSNIDGLVYYVRHFIASDSSNENLLDIVHKHHAMEFHCVFSGDATVTLPSAKQEIRLKPGQILMIPSGVFHSVHCETPLDRFAFSFGVDLPDQTSVHPLLQAYSDINECLLVDDADIFSMIQMHQNLLQQEPSAFGDVQKGTLLLNIALQVISRSPAIQALNNQPANRVPKEKWLIEDYVSKCFDQANSIKALADILHLSEAQARKLVRSYLGEDFKSIIIRYRMELADILLQDPNLTFEEIAWEVGYSSYSGFQLSFKKFFGITPSERREQFMKNQ